jgi:hypothetical protein
VLPKQRCTGRNLTLGPQGPSGTGSTPVRCRQERFRGVPPNGAVDISALLVTVERRGVVCLIRPRPNFTLRHYMKNRN